MTARPNIRVTQSQRLGLTLGLQTSIRLLKADAAGLTRYLEEQAAENPQLLLSSPPDAGEWSPRWERAFAGGGLDPDLAASAGPSLMAHVEARIAALHLPAAHLRVAELLAEGLEPTGWLGCDLVTVAAESGQPQTVVAAVLRRLQGIEPAGLFARNLAECLLLQAVEAGLDDPVLRGVLAHLQLMAAGDVARLARLIGATEAEVAARFRLIRGFDPKPGAQFSALVAPPREPDLIVRRGTHGWIVSLNRGALPGMAVNPGRGDGRAAARVVVRMVESRNATLLRVGTEVMRRQEAALDHGISALLPLTMAEVAAALNLHQATVSRVVAGTCIDTPRGMLWLRALFSNRIGTGETSGAALRARLAELVRHEPAGRPLSDAELAEALSDGAGQGGVGQDGSGQGGARVARRTVAKYRDMLGIPPAHRRRARRD